MPTDPEKVRLWEKIGSNRAGVKTTRMTQNGVRQESWQRIGGDRTNTRSIASVVTNGYAVNT